MSLLLPLENAIIQSDSLLAMRISDAARALSIGRTTVYKLIGDGTLQTITVGRRRLILTRSIQELCDQPQSKPHAAKVANSSVGYPH